MDDTPPDRALLGVRAYLGHEVVMYLRLEFGSTLDIHLVLMGDKVCQLLTRDQTSFVLRSRKSDPYLSKEQPFMLFGPERPHLFASISPGERGDESVV
jgi:hypothetical protein